MAGEKRSFVGSHKHHPNQRNISLWLDRELLAELERARRKRRLGRSEFVRYAIARAVGYSERQALLASRAEVETGGPKNVGRPDPRGRVWRRPDLPRGARSMRDTSLRTR